MIVPTQSQPRRHSSCHRHPTKPITGFCASCLRERLAGIDPDTHQETPITHLAAELRRCKSYSTTTNLNASSSSTTSTTATSEPRRKSCDVRSKNTLSDLFRIDDKKGYSLNNKPKVMNSGLELKEDEENGAEISVSVVVNAPNINDFDEEDGEFKTMKEFIDLEFERKRNASRDIAGSFWEVASVFRKKLVKWQLKQKKDKREKKNGGILDGRDVDSEKQSIKKLRDTQSEIGVYGFGRRSCDTDPRLSLDVARLSVEDARHSFDEPRASWDGYLIGKTYPRLAPPLVSVVEDAKLPTDGIDNRKENEDGKNEEESSSPGGTAQTRDYYSDRRRRRSFDRLSSSRRLTLGDDEFKSISNAKVSPETVGLFHGAKLLVTEKELRDSNWYSLKDYQVETSDGVSKDVDSVAASVSKGFNFKKLQRWRSVWNIWGLMQKRSESKGGDVESSNGGNVADGHIPEETVGQKLIRSYSVSARESNRLASRVSSIEAKEYGTKRREELMLQRNRSARYSPNSLDNGMLRFYLTPLRAYGRSKSGKSRLQNSQSVARNVL